MIKKFTQPKAILILCLILHFCLSNSISAQTSLVAGDIAFIGYNSNNNGTGGQNDFCFVILRPAGISLNTSISFTDNGYKRSSNVLNNTEGTLVWTSTSAMAQFTKVYVKIEPNSGNSVLSLSAGSIAAGFSNFILSQAGDQVLAYQGSSSNPAFISGIHMNNESATATAALWDNLAAATTINSNRSDIPPALTNGTNAIMVVPSPSTASSEKDNAVYNCTGATGSFSAIRNAINNVTNWSLQDVTLYPLPPACTFSGGTVPLRLISFEGKPTNGANNLMWKTASESSIKEYEIQRSSNAINYVTIETVIARNTASQVYTYNDKISFTGSLYYRLKIKELDGMYTYSPVIMLGSQSGIQAALSPNPARHLVTIRTKNNALINTEAVIMDVKGSTVLKQKIQSASQTINLANLTHGLYFVKFATGQVQKLVKE